MLSKLSSKVVLLINPFFVQNYKTLNYNKNIKNFTIVVQLNFYLFFILCDFLVRIFSVSYKTFNYFTYLIFNLLF